MKQATWFSRVSSAVSNFTGRPLAFGLAVGSVVIWAATGPIFHFSDTWQLVMNTASGLITFLMVFLIQGSQNRDTAAIQIKLDELIRTNEHAKNTLLDLEELEPDDITGIRKEYVDLATKARDDQVAEEGVPEVALDAIKTSEPSQE